MPIFFSCLPTEKPGSVRSTMKAEISFSWRLSVVVGHGKEHNDVGVAGPLVMKHLEPLRIQFSPFSFITAVVCWPGSVGTGVGLSQAEGADLLAGAAAWAGTSFSAPRCRAHRWGRSTGEV